MREKELRAAQPRRKTRTTAPRRRHRHPPRPRGPGLPPPGPPDSNGSGTSRTSARGSGSCTWPPSSTAATREGHRIRHGRQHENRPRLRAPPGMAVRRCPHQKNVTIFHTRPGQPVHLTAIRPAPGAPQDPPLRRPHGSVLGQRLGRIIQRHPEERTRPPHGVPHTRKGHQLLLPRGSRPTLQSHAAPLNARLPHPQRGRTRAEKPETRSLRPPKTTVRETPSTPGFQGKGTQVRDWSVRAATGGMAGMRACSRSVMAAMSSWS